MVLQRTVSQKEIEDFTTRGLVDLQRGRTALGIASLHSAYEKSLQDETGALRNGCAFNLGAALMAAGDAERALPVLRKIPPEIFGPRGALHLNLALCLEQLRREEESLQEFQFAFEAMDEKNGELNTRAEIAVRLASAKQSSESWSEASKWYLAASQLYHRLHQPLPRARCLMRHAEGALKAGDGATAGAALDEARGVLRDVSEGPHRGQLLCEIGVLLLHINRVPEAVAALREALPELSDAAVKGTARQNLGAALNVQQKFEEALPEHRAAIKLFGESGSRASQGHSFVNLGAAQNELGLKDEARESFSHALQAAEDANDVRTQWQCLEALGVLAFNSGDFARAVESFERGMSLSTASGERQQLVRRLEHALEQRQNVERLRSNPNLGAAKVTVEVEESETESESEEEQVSPEVTQAIDRIVKVTADGKTKEWRRYYARKTTEDKMFPNPKKNRVLLVNDAVLVPVDADARGPRSLTSVSSTEDSSPDSSSSESSAEDEAEDEEEDVEAVRENYQKALNAPAIEKTRDRLEELAKRYGEEKPERKDSNSSSSSGASEVARLTTNPPTIPVFPGTAQLEGRDVGTYEPPRRTRGLDDADPYQDDDDPPPPPLPERLEDFPRGDRERVLNDVHQSLRRTESESETGSEKRSTACRLM